MKFVDFIRSLTPLQATGNALAVQFNWIIIDKMIPFCQAEYRKRKHACQGNFGNMRGKNPWLRQCKKGFAPFKNKKMLDKNRMTRVYG